MAQSGFFSISYRLILTDSPLPYDMFINSSGLEGRDHYIRIAKRGDVLAARDPELFENKYRRLYVAESQRGDYLKSLCKLAGKEETEKSEVLKDSAIRYLGGLFDHEKPVTVESFNESMQGCRDVVEGFVDVLQGYNVDQLRDLIANLSFHDFYTFDHSINVSMYCVVLYRAFFPNASRTAIMNAGFGGLLHDLGKIKISTEIINKPNKLTAEEFAEIMRHPDLGREILSGSGIRVPEGIDLRLLQSIIYQHHENFDGTGYPNRIKGENIEVYARICAIADFFDAITTKRSYHDALQVDDALALMRQSVGKKLDPKLFEVFTHQTKHFNFTRQPSVTVAPDFDPCQPHDKSAFQLVKIIPLDQKGNAVPRSDDFGKIVFKMRRKKAG
jgi:HD-GYP domain-containing protein (c-di-GMP phosphodiesterase class II)